MLFGAGGSSLADRPHAPASSQRVYPSRHTAAQIELVKRTNAEANKKTPTSDEVGFIIIGLLGLASLDFLDQFSCSFPLLDSGRRACPLSVGVAFLGQSLPDVFIHFPGRIEPYAELFVKLKLSSPVPFRGSLKQHIYLVSLLGVLTSTSDYQT